MADEMCFVHGCPEPSLPGDYRSCFECGHVWRTRSDYVADVLVAEMGCPTVDLPFCPLCSHDW